MKRIPSYWKAIAVSGILIAILLYFRGADRPCSTLPPDFESDEQAIKEIRAANFEVKEFLRGNENSGIYGADFFSCDGEKGYLIVEAEFGTEQIFRDVPVSVWEDFKEAELSREFFEAEVLVRGKPGG